MTEILLYTSENKQIKVEMLIENETMWLPQARIAELFGTTKQNVGQHFKNIFAEHELDEKAVVKDLFTTASDGKKYKTKHYNLDAIISVGYRVNSTQATQFRIWATQVLKEYIIKGFAMDDERFKNPEQPFGKDYFDEQLERIRDIVTMYLDFAEFQAKNKNIMYQKDWIEKLNKFLMLNDREVLQDNGTITAQLAKELAEHEYTKYKKIQDSAYLSDFDHLLLKLEER